MLLSEAQETANRLIDFLKPFCTKIHVAGSVRREKENVKDIEICLIPSDKKKLFNALGTHLYMLNKEFKPSKWGQKYLQFKYEGKQIDLFIGEENNWGLFYLIRTGSAAFSTNILAQWKRVTHGGYSENGYLHTAEGTLVNTPDEETVFKLCKMDFVVPRNRSINFK
jgi:DNA polymerase/3'-5' exonuclease PolX